MPIATPPDAVTVTDWTDAGQAFRTFAGSSWRVPVAGDVVGYNIVSRQSFDIPIQIRGVQFADGRVERWVAMGEAPEDLPVQTARVLAESLAAAVAEFGRHQ